ncbi:MAG: Fic family protein [Sutterellaceae bacterium]|nr:Fic family protein [Sutterellaceae bacterium]
MRLAKLNATIRPLKVPTDFLNLVSEIEGFNGAWKASCPFMPDRLAELRQQALVMSTAASCRIEGNRLSNKEVAAVIERLLDVKPQSRDEAEVVGYATVLKRIFGSWKEIPISESSIKALHREMFEFCDDAAHRGQYKHRDNNIAAFRDGKCNGVIARTVSAKETPVLMRDLVDWVNVSLDEQQLHPLLVIGVFVVTFLAIHPFEDGNGRLSRLLTTLLLLKCGYDFVQFESLETVNENGLATYYCALRLTQKTLESKSPDWEPWLYCFLKSLCAEVRELEKKVAREIDLRALPETSLRILELVEKKSRIKMAELLTQTGVPKSTLRKHLDKLVRDGRIRQNGVRKGTFYTPM